MSSSKPKKPLKKKGENPNQVKVVIIGSGAAGVSAAVKLEEFGFEDFIVLEASDRIGGRVCSKSVRDGGPRVEIGAQWIHGEENNVVYEIAYKLGYLPKGSPEPLSEADAAFILEGKILDSAVIFELAKIFSHIEEGLEKELMDAWHNYTSLKHYFDSKLGRVGDVFFKKIHLKGHHSHSTPHPSNKQTSLYQTTSRFQKAKKHVHNSENR